MNELSNLILLPAAQGLPFTGVHCAFAPLEAGPAVKSKLNQKSRRTNTCRKTCYCRAPSALACHENGVAELVCSRIELPVGDSGGKLDGVLVYCDRLVAVLNVVGIRVEIHLGKENERSRGGPRRLQTINKQFKGLNSGDSKIKKS